MKVREGGRVIKIAVMVATGVNADGFCEILGVATSTAESGAGWNTFFKDHVARGLNGVALVTSDAHTWLVDAIGATLPGASWQRCRTHYTANLMSICPKHAWGGVLLVALVMIARNESVVTSVDLDLVPLNRVPCGEIPDLTEYRDSRAASSKGDTGCTADPLQRDKGASQPFGNCERKMVQAWKDIHPVVPDRRSEVLSGGGFVTLRHADITAPVPTGCVDRDPNEGEHDLLV